MTSRGSVDKCNHITGSFCHHLQGKREFRRNFSTQTHGVYYQNLKIFTFTARGTSNRPDSPKIAAIYQRRIRLAEHVASIDDDKCVRKILTAIYTLRSIEIKTLWNVMLLPVFYGCDTWFLILFAATGNSLKISEPRRQEVTVEWRKIRNKALYDFTSYCNDNEMKAESNG